MPRIFRDTLETVCIYLQQKNNKDLLGPEEENQFANSAVALSRSSNWPFAAFWLPFPAWFSHKFSATFHAKTSGLCQTSCLLQCI